MDPVVLELQTMVSMIEKRLADQDKLISGLYKKINEVAKKSETIDLKIGQLAKCVREKFDRESETREVRIKQFSQTMHRYVLRKSKELESELKHESL